MSAGGLTIGLVAVLLAANLAFAQPVQAQPSSPATSGPSSGASVEQASTARNTPADTSADDSRACDGCPPRRVGTALLQTTVVNVLYEAGNLARGQVTARVTPATWWANVKRGWEWDLDDFVVNQIGHPYQGSNYFNAGRANGLSFWESAALTAFGSGTWEYFGETNRPSLNDFINTLLGGVALGEMSYRAAWLVRDTRATGHSRFASEFAAMAIDPLTGFNRFLSGDASRVVDKPRDLVPDGLAAATSAGIGWRRSSTPDVEPAIDPFLRIELRYGDLETGRSRAPYDGFTVDLHFGAGSTLSEARVRGRLFGRSFRDGALQVNVAQHYDFNHNNAYRFGAQSIEANVGWNRELTSRLSMRAMAWGALTALGAVDSRPPDQTPGPPPPSPGRGISVGPRFYDYGPGGNFGGVATLRRDGHPILTLAYDAYHLYVLDGVRANHLLQRARADLRIPLKGQLGMNVISEYFDRRTFFQDPSLIDAEFHFPQVRVGVTWRTN